MIGLDAHAMFARCLGSALSDCAAVETDPVSANLFAGLSTALLSAADAMDQAVSESGLNHACTLNHAALKASKCPACGAPRGTN